MTRELYADRESINPRAFAVRHLVIQEVKFRKAASSAHGTNQHAQLDRVARGVDVSYDGGRHVLVVRCEGTEVRVLPLDALPLYAHGDATSPASQPGADPRRWDSALEKNRQLVRSLVEAMLAGLAVAAP